MSVDVYEYPDDLYATKEDGLTSPPMPMPPRKPIAPFRFARHARAPIPISPTPETLPDADLPLFTPQGPKVLTTADQLIDRCRLFLSTADVEKIREAYRYADNAHLGQFRKSGEPYITHPIAVASILASWKMDAETIEAGLMHDVLEDTPIGKREMVEKFGVAVAELVDGVSKLDKLRFSSNEVAQAESFRKMLLAMSKDVRVILVKLADRLHNLRTLGVMRPEKRARIARETLDIYVPIAHRLGMNNVFRELQELSFANRYPLRYKVLYENVLRRRQERRQILEQILNATREHLSRDGIRCRILGRDKTIYGIYNKMREKHQSLTEALDIYGFRVVVHSLEDCYLTLGALHRLYKPVHARFKDFIAIPKTNGYQSLHTTVIGPDGTPVEYQIRTETMHRIDEDGILVHWLYNTDEGTDDLQSKTTAWLQNLLEIQRNSTDSQEFLENIKVDLFPNRVYVFTPAGKIISLPKGSSAIDFAYEIHTEVGNTARAAKINGETRPLSSELRNGDLVQIIRADHPTPTPEWLEHVHSGKARAEIRQYLRNSKREESVTLGRAALEAVAEEQGIDLTPFRTELRERVLRDFGVEDEDELFEQIGLGKLLPAALLHRISALGEQAERPTVVIRGTEGAAVKLADCCHPIPGDKICGFGRPGAGLTVHRRDCPHAEHGMQADPTRWMEVQWGDPKPGSVFAVELAVTVTDAHAGLATVATSVAEARSSIIGLSLTQESPNPVVTVTVQVRDSSHLIHVMRTLRQNDAVKKVKRVMD